MTQSFKSITKGLKQAIGHEKGKNQLRVKEYDISEPKGFTARQIRTIRVNSGFTQSIFAKVFGVSQKTIEAWEAGTNLPSGPARRMLGILSKNPKFLIDQIRQ